MVDQVAERARTDILTPDQPQPIEPLLVGQSGPLDHASPPGCAEALRTLTARTTRPVFSERSTWRPADRLASYFGSARAPILPSVPFISRATFARCMNHSRMLSAKNNAAASDWPSSQSPNGVSALATSAANDE